MKRLFSAAFLSFLLIACANEGKKKSLEVTEESIDAYVAEKLDTNQNYKILTGLRFSKDNDTYAPVQFSQNDTVILCTEELVDASGITYRNIFFKHDLPIYIEEYKSQFIDNQEVYSQRKIYFNGAIVLKAYEKTAPTEEELIDASYKEITMTMNQFDFDRPKDAVLQRGDYEMKFGEFLVFDQQSYLVLENEKSGYNVALFIVQGDNLLDELYSNPETYKGKTIHPYHEFSFIAGLDRVVYMGGYIVEDKAN